MAAAAADGGQQRTRQASAGVQIKQLQRGQIIIIASRLIHRARLCSGGESCCVISLERRILAIGAATWHDPAEAKSNFRFHL